MSLPERRRFPRYLLRADLEIEWGSRTLQVTTDDISLGGMFVATSDPLWVGAEFAARVLLEDPLPVDCVVRRVLPGQGMGVQFVALTDSSRAKLEKLLGTLARQ